MHNNKWYGYCLRIIGLVCGLLLICNTSVANDRKGSFTDPGDVGTATSAVGGGTRGLTGINFQKDNKSDKSDDKQQTESNKGEKGDNKKDTGERKDSRAN